MPAMKKPSDQDLELADHIRNAEYFTAFLRLSPTETYRDEQASYEAAVAAGDALVAKHSRFGKRAVIYAVRAGQTYCCTPALIALSRELAQ